jgi:Raf kinase inhibitor-like YbhB/YbcL family protein
MPFVLSTDAFQPEGDIPAKYTCSGANVSPHLQWANSPAGTKSLALIVDDPDAPVGTFTHWLLYNLDAGAKELQENVAQTERLPGALQGRNDFRRIGYGGPCPPPGKPHRYYFKLYALDSTLNLQPGATRSDVDQAMQGHVVGQAQIMGKFKR